MHTKIKDILISKDRLVVIPSNFTIKQALKTLREKNPDRTEILGIGFLIYNEQKELVGSMCLKDFIKGLAPQFLQPVGSAQVLVEDETTLSELWDSILDNQSKRFSEEPVSKYYIPIKVFAEPEDPITKAAYQMIFHDLSFLAVLEDKKRLIGAVTIFDVFRELSSLILEE